MKRREVEGSRAFDSHSNLFSAGIGTGQGRLRGTGVCVGQANPLDRRFAAVWVLEPNHKRNITAT
eukprot:361622-Chlamydomonas_euryale.AAC.2